MVYLQIKEYNGKNCYTLNISQRTNEVVNDKNVYKTATEYLSALEYKCLLDSGLFIEKDKYIFKG